MTHLESIDAGLKAELYRLQEQRKAFADAAIKGEISEIAGETAADAVAIQKGWGTQLCKTCPGRQGEFDRVFQKADGTVIVVEAKGGNSLLGGREVAGGYAQQGTTQYRDGIIQKMVASPNPDVSATGTKIRNARRDVKLEYWEVRQGFDTNGNLVDITVKRFN